MLINLEFATVTFLLGVIVGILLTWWLFRIIDKDTKNEEKENEKGP